MPELDYGEMIADEIKTLRDEVATLKAERATADEDRTKEIDGKFQKHEERLGFLEKQKEAVERAAIPGLEYGRKGEEDKPTWTRLLQAIVEPERLRNKAYGPEKEVIDYQRKTAINAATGAAGGFLVPTTMMDGLIPELRERSVARLLGATVLNGLTPGAHQFVKSRGGITAVHINTEEEESGTESVPTFDQITLSPRTIAAFVPMTRGMMQQSAVSMEPWVRGEIAKQIALAQDEKFFKGTGANSQPRGIFNHPNVQSFTFGVGTIPAVWNALVDAVLDTRTVNGLGLAGLGWVTHPAVTYWLAKILDIQGRPLFDDLMSGDFATTGVPSRLMNYPLFDTSQVAGGATADIMFGPWSSGVIGEWSTLELVLNTESDTNFLKARGTVRGLMDYDVNAFHANTFTKATVDSTATPPTALS